MTVHYLRAIIIALCELLTVLIIFIVNKVTESFCPGMKGAEMKDEQKEFFEVLISFRKLNISSMLPNITHGDFCILKRINQCSQSSGLESEKVKVSDIVKQLMVPPSAVSRGLRSLEERELIVRTVDKKDRRNTFVELTPAGKDMVDQVDEIMTDFADAVCGNLGQDTMRKLNGYLRQLRETAMTEIEKRKYKGEKGETEYAKNC